MNTPRELTPKEEAFVNEYLRTWNATEAAKRVGYKHPNKVGPRKLVEVGIAEEIKKRLESKAMAADEVLARLAEQARFNPVPYILFEEFRDEEGGLIVKAFAGIDLDKLQEDGLGHVLKGISKTRNGLKIEFHDAQRALELIGKHLGLFKERVEHSGQIDIARLEQMTDDELEQLAQRLGLNSPSG
jgi:phage terminase small subunit